MAKEETVTPEVVEAPVEAPAETVAVSEPQRFAVIVDQKGFFLRAEVNGVELAENEFDLYEEEVEVKEVNQSVGDEEAEEVVEAVSGDKCPNCNGRGLVSDTQVCEPCEGSGKVK